MCSVLHTEMHTQLASDLIISFGEYVFHGTYSVCALALARTNITQHYGKKSIKTNKWENNIFHRPEFPMSLIGLMTALLSSSLMAIFTSAFLKMVLYCSIPAFLHPQEYALPAAVTCIFWDLTVI